MSTTDDKNNNEVLLDICANCGKGEDDTNSLKTCTACKMVKYCNRECQIAHRPLHKKECKKRAIELHDEALFKQPPQEEDCPICFLRMPTLESGTTYMICCGKVICNGCIHAVQMRDRGVGLCPFCRTPVPKSDEEIIEKEKKRVEAGDAEAIYSLGNYYADGEYGFTQNCAKAVELWHQAGELGCAQAYNNVGTCYNEGEGVQVDKKKAICYYELAAMKGCVIARDNLGCIEEEAGNMDRAIKHFMIAVKGGDKDSLATIQKLHSIGGATKEEYTQALRSYQAYLDEIKSIQRDKAAAYSDDYRYY